MSGFRFTIAGEAHGPGLVGILTGIPRGLPLDSPALQTLLTRRRAFPGRGPRSSFEDQPLQWLSGVSSDDTTSGGPLSFLIPNADSSRSHSLAGTPVALEFPRPGHADAAGAARWGLQDASPVAELASGRITAAYSAVGHVCAQILRNCRIHTLAHVVQLGARKARPRTWVGPVQLAPSIRKAGASLCQALSPKDDAAFLEQIQKAARDGDTVGGIVEVIASPMPAGLGACQPLDHRLDSMLGQMVLGVPGVKGVEIGRLSQHPAMRGRDVHDSFETPLRRTTNVAGGLEGGMSNGQPLVVRALVKPVPTLQRPLNSCSLADGRPGPAVVVRSDVCAVPPTALAVEAMVRICLAEVLLADGWVHPVTLHPPQGGGTP